ncbi:MAG: alpha-hydroxy-acid oxidizing protein, partial [Thermoplasmatota archaeon]
MTDLARFVALADFEDAAARILPPDRWAYIAGGAMDEGTVAANRAAFARWTFRPRVMVDVSRITLDVEWLGRRRATPFYVAPMAMHRAAHASGESATARAAAASGALFVASTSASETLEETAAASAGEKWFQLYVHKDRKLTASLVERAARAGYAALVVT